MYPQQHGVDPNDFPAAREDPIMPTHECPYDKIIYRFNKERENRSR
jgi:hypothetical protein